MYRDKFTFLHAMLAHAVAGLFLMANPAVHAEEGTGGSGQTGRYTVVQGGVVLDSTSNLMWQQNAIERGNLDTAKRYCKKISLAGHRDWRLPTVEEFETLVNEREPIQRHKPQFDTAVFPRNKAVRYWAFKPGTGVDMFGEVNGDSYTYNMERRRKEFGGTGFIPYIWCVRDAN